MLKSMLIVMMAILSPLSVNNGYYQTTKIEFEGINEQCYGTLLCDKTVSGSWSSTLTIDLNAPEKVINAFKEYKDSGRFYYLNYFQDVSEGLLYWPYYPPENFKILLYYPEKDLFVESDVIQRYALTSTYRADVTENGISVERNYDYGKMVLITIARILIAVAVSAVVALLYGRPNTNQHKYVYLTNGIFQVILNICVSIYSFRNGFNVYEHILILWIPYIIFFLIQGHIFSRKVGTMISPYLTSFFSSVTCYFVGLLLVDVFPRLFTIV